MGWRQFLSWGSFFPGVSACVRLTENPHSELSTVCRDPEKPAAWIEWALTQWQHARGSVCVYIQCCWRTSFLWVYTESALCYMVEFLSEWAVLYICTVELLEKPAPLMASGEWSCTVLPSRLNSLVLCSLQSIFALSHCCPEWDGVSRGDHPLSVQQYILVCSCKAPGSEACDCNVEKLLCFHLKVQDVHFYWNS